MNQLSQQGLWEKIQNFPIDDPHSSFPFSKKLAQQNNWTASFTQKAIEEYRKFIYLCCVLPQGASPSPVIDEVWHLHLTYTDNYWNKFCRQTLEKDIHHHPSKGGTDEAARHHNWYLQTWEQYQALFGYPPPVHIWPLPLQQQSSFKQVYDKGFISRCIAGFIAALLLYSIGFSIYHVKGPAFLLHFAVVAVAALLLTYLTLLHKQKKITAFINQLYPLQSNSFQMSRFLYGTHRAYQAALLDLIERDILESKNNEYALLTNRSFNPDDEKNPLLLPITNYYAKGEYFSYNTGLQYFTQYYTSDEKLDVLIQLTKKVDYLKLIIPLLVLTTGMIRILQGITNNKPVGFLVLEMALFGFACLVLLDYYSYTKSIRRVVAEKWVAANSNGYSDNLINNFSVRGTAALAGMTGLVLLANDFDAMIAQQERAVYGSDSGYSSSCSSTGCSSGCGGGGCGGCGGGD